MIRPKSLINGRYRVERKIGEGGMAIVYQVHDLLLARDVAIKTPRPQFASDSAFRARFQREARASASLSHPNIIDVFDVGEEKGQPYIVMELVRGQTLKEIIASEAPFHPADVGELLRQVGGALDYAHKRGYVHRDIKPSNVMVIDELSDDDKSYPGPYSQHVKLLDFGIAKCNACNDEKPAQLTQPGFVFGSPLYMSPEQCKGQEVDQRSDIYSLGCMYYEMLKGEPPFKGESAVHTFAMHLYEKPVTLPIGDGDGFVSQELNDIVLKCLEKDREARWNSASQLRQALKDLYKF